MRKTIFYISEEVKRALRQMAAARGVSEAELIREALHRLTSQTTRPRPRLPLFKSGKRRLTERVDEALLGFGEGLKALVERESARRLAKLGGTEPRLRQVPRRRYDPA